MTAPKYAVMVDGIRHYLHPVTGELYPSVTSVLKVLDKENLREWYASKAASWALDNPGMLTSDPARAREYMKNAAQAYTTVAADLGSAVHLAVENRLNGVDQELTKGVKPFINSFEKWRETSGIEFTHVEATIINRTMRYAGTTDFIGKLGDIPILGDWKTGASMARNRNPYPEVALQVAALMHGEVILHEDGTESPMPQVDECIVVLLRPRSCRAYLVHNLDAHWKAFQHARMLTHWRLHESTGNFTEL